MSSKTQDYGENLTSQAYPPKRDEDSDEYVEENDIDYKLAGMTVSGMRWEYRIFSPESKPTRDYGVIGDIAICEDTVWYRDTAKWRRATCEKDSRGIPCQKHPLLKGRYRLDCGLEKWRGYATCYSQYRHKILREHSAKMKEDPEPIVVRKIKGEPVHIDLSRDNHWTLTDSVDGGKDRRRTILIDLSLDEDMPKQRIAFLLPSSRRSAAHRAKSDASPLVNAKADAPPQREKPSVPSLLPLGRDDDDDDMYMDPPQKALVRGSDSDKKINDSERKEKNQDKTKTTLSDHPLVASLDRHFSNFAKDRKDMLEMMKLQKEELKFQREQSAMQMSLIVKRLDALEARKLDRERRRRVVQSLAQ